MFLCKILSKTKVFSHTHTCDIVKNTYMMAKTLCFSSCHLVCVLAVLLRCAWRTHQSYTQPASDTSFREYKKKPSQIQIIIYIHDELAHPSKLFIRLYTT